jgi:hypothetical protein
MMLLNGAAAGKATTVLLLEGKKGNKTLPATQILLCGVVEVMVVVSTG